MSRSSSSISYHGLSDYTISSANNSTATSPASRITIATDNSRNTQFNLEASTNGQYAINEMDRPSSSNKEIISSEWLRASKVTLSSITRQVTQSSHALPSFVLDVRERGTKGVTQMCLSNGVKGVNRMWLVTKRVALVLCPGSGVSKTLAREPELFGPVFCVFVYALMVAHSTHHPQRRRINLDVLWVLSVWLAGSFLICGIQRLLGGTATLRATLCVLGYCIAPLVVLSPLLWIVEGQQEQLGSSMWWYVCVLVLKLVMIAWATGAAGGFLVAQVMGHKCALMVYPCLLLYIYMVSLLSEI